MQALDYTGYEERAHGFRTVGDSGANAGLIVSSTGFQRSAVEAAAYSNMRLVTWQEFQALFAERWFRNYMSPRIAQATDVLHEYTEPINTRVFPEAAAYLFSSASGSGRFVTPPAPRSDKPALLSSGGGVAAASPPVIAGPFAIPAILCGGAPSPRTQRP